jgi:DNA-binding transcriptional MerR regulator/methylmalonyl-CoA mutase cobalamin-binding subunit
MSRLRDTSPTGNDENVGRYRIQAVAQMTGVSAATLRAWERRYGIPVPKRSSSSYRLYSDRDIELVRRVRQLCDDGMAPSQAAREVIAQRDPTPVEPKKVAPPSEDVYQLATGKILEGIERFDPDSVKSAIERALYLGPSVTVFQRILAPTLAEVGKRWEKGTLSISQEHLAAELIGNAVRYILSLAQPDKSKRRILLACFADEEHVTPLYGIALSFASWGYKSVMLGARTPTHALRHAVAEVQPDIIGLSVTVKPPPYRARELVDGYAQACHPLPWIVGGSAAPSIADLVQSRGGAIASPNPERTRELVERMVASFDSTRH